MAPIGRDSRRLLKQHEILDVILKPRVMTLTGVNTVKLS